VMFNGTAQLFAAELNTIIDCWLWKQFAGFDKVTRAFKNPRIANSAPADHDTVNARFLKHAPGILWRGDIPVANNRNFQSGRVFQLLEPLPASFALVLLIAGARMHRQRFNAQIL